MVDNYERLINNPGGSQSSQQTLDRDFQNYSFFKEFLEGRDSVLAIIGEPVVTEQEIFLGVYQDGYLKIAIILVFAGFFIAVFYAFVLNAIRNIKADEESMKKINDALGKDQ
jgi:hypothetical protein